MIEGIVTEDGVPAINVEIGSQSWQAIIDTGFNGELELPEQLGNYRLLIDFPARTVAIEKT